MPQNVTTTILDQIFKVEAIYIVPTKGGLSKPLNKLLH